MRLVTTYKRLIEIVMLRLWPKAKSQAKPAVKKPSQAGPFSRLEMAFGLAQDFTKPEPGVLAAAFYPIFFVNSIPEIFGKADMHAFMLSEFEL